MWARITEILLAIWILVSHQIFSYEGLPSLFESDLCLAVAIFFLATLSFIEKFHQLHLLEIFPIGWMFYVAFSYPTPILPFALQNYIIVATLLLMFAVVPSRGIKA